MQYFPSLESSQNKKGQDLIILAFMVLYRIHLCRAIYFGDLPIVHLRSSPWNTNKKPAGHFWSAG
jgi:hypothetical protein